MTVLKGIPSLISPTLLRILAEMGHGDELVLADANFPSHSVAKHTVHGAAVAYDGTGVPELLTAILTLMPLDRDAGAGKGAVAVMRLMDEHVAAGWKQPEVWATYRDIVKTAEGQLLEFEEGERFEFYERAKRAYAVVATGETALYGNIILKKGIIGKRS